MDRLKGKVILISGGACGQGAAEARLFVAEGARVVIGDVLEVATAIKLARELEPYDIAWFEEPVSPDDHAGQAEVRRSTTIPIASGE
ncbi:MAG: enolase C-terminal domain-like protein, partial [Stellaceae bacterium]